MKGYIKLYRDVLDNPIVTKDADYFAVWGYLLLNAAHEKKSALFNGKRVELMPGQLITGRKTIAERLHIHESKVQRVLKCFESEQQIEQQANRHNRLITVKNWGKYQSSEQQNEQQVNNNRTTSEQQVNTNKKEKKEKNVKNNITPLISPHKVQCADFVAMTNAEKEALIAKYGEADTLRMIEILDNYKGQSGKKYKSDYRAILNWVVDRLAEEKRKKPSSVYDASKTDFSEIEKIIQGKM